MALTVEDGTVVSGADAYENAATTATRLTNLGLADFDGKAEANQEQIIRRRTVECEDLLREFVTGRARDEDFADQPRLYPRRNSFDRDGYEFDYDEIPEALKRGIAFRCEDDAAGRISTDGRMIKSEASARGRIEYAGARANRFAQESPEAHASLMRLRWTAA